MDEDKDFYAPRRCMREPIKEIFEAAQLLSSAADAHLAGNRSGADCLLREANMPVVRAWTESLWGSEAANPDQRNYRRFRVFPGAPVRVEKEQRIAKRLPPLADRMLIIKRYGRKCVFCGIPLISEQVRKAFHLAYPDGRAMGRHEPNPTCGLPMHVDAVRSHHSA